MSSSVAHSPTPQPTSPNDHSESLPLRRLLALAALGVAAALYPKLAFPAAVLSLIAGLALPKLIGKERKVAWLLLSIASVSSTVGVGRFVLLEALPGVVAGGRAAVEKQAVAFVRGIVVAQDYARRKALRDDDKDGIGSSLSLKQLGGYEPIAGTHLGQSPPLAFKAAQLVETASGTALSRAGYLFLVCLPEKNGEFSADSTRDFDAERAETSYLAYAWPQKTGPGAPQTSYFTDAYEGVLELRPARNTPSRYHGAMRPPSCTAPTAAEGWLPWKEKQPRDALPGGEQ